MFSFRKQVTQDLEVKIHTLNGVPIGVHDDIVLLVDVLDTGPGLDGHPRGLSPHVTGRAIRNVPVEPHTPR